MNTFTLNAHAIAQISVESTDAVKKTALAMITKNLRGALTEADNVESLTIPTGTITAQYRDGTTREFSSVMPVLKLLSIDKGNLATLIDNFETAQILKGCAIIPELAYKEVTEKPTKNAKKGVITVESTLLECIKTHYDAIIRDMQASYTAIASNLDLQNAYLRGIELDSKLTIDGQDIECSKVVEQLIVAKLAEKLEQVEASFGAFKFTKVAVTADSCSYKLESFSDTGKTTIIERLTPFGFQAGNIAFKSDTATKDSRNDAVVFF